MIGLHGGAAVKRIRGSAGLGLGLGSGARDATGFDNVLGLCRGGTMTNVRALISSE